MYKKLKIWLPTIIFCVLAIFFAVYYKLTDDSLKTVYIQLVICMFIPAIFPVIGIITKKPYPMIITIMACYLVFVGIFLGKAMNFYALIRKYDKFLHTGFGLVGSAMVYILLMRWGGEKLAPAGVVAIVLIGTLGVGAIWELIEYISALVTFEDPQRVIGTMEKVIAVGNAEEAWKQGLNPLDDTMWDLLVTVFGSIAFLACYIVDRILGGKLFKKLFTINEEKAENKVEENTSDKQ